MSFETLFCGFAGVDGTQEFSLLNGGNWDPSLRNRNHQTGLWLWLYVWV